MPAADENCEISTRCSDWLIRSLIRTAARLRVSRAVPIVKYPSYVYIWLTSLSHHYLWEKQLGKGPEKGPGEGPRKGLWRGQGKVLGKRSGKGHEKGLGRGLFITCN